MVKTGPEIERIVGQYLTELAMQGIKVDRVLLYGSYAKGQAREESDIDLIVVSSDFGAMNIRERLEVLGIAAARIMQPVQARGYTPEEMASANKEAFLSEVLQHSRIAA